MKRLKTLGCVMVFLGLCAAVALAQTTTQTYRQTGNLVGASAYITGPNYQANVNISPAVAPGSNQEMYVVNWMVTVYGTNVVPPPVCVVPPTPPPPPADMVSTTVSGLVPASAIQRLASGALSVNLDIGKLQQQYANTMQCLGGVCNPVPPPATFPLVGTFTPITGPSAFSSSSSGNRSTLNVDVVCRFMYSFSGNQTDTSARFAGQIGSVSVTDMGVGSNAQLHVQKGQMTQTSVCTPPTP